MRPSTVHKCLNSTFFTSQVTELLQRKYGDCMFFVSQPAGELFVGGGGNLNKYRVRVYDMLFAPFFARHCRFISTTDSPFPSPGGATGFTKSQKKMAKTPTNRLKRLCDDFV